MDYDFSDNEFEQIHLYMSNSHMNLDKYHGTVSKKEITLSNPKYFKHTYNISCMYDSDDTDEDNLDQETIRQVEIIKKLNKEYELENSSIVDSKPYKLSIMDNSKETCINQSNKYQLIVIQENKTNSSKEVSIGDTSIASNEKKKRGRPKGSTKKIYIENSSKCSEITNSKSLDMKPKKYTYNEINSFSLKMLLDIGKENNIKGLTGKKKSDIIQKLIDNNIVIN